MVANLRPCEPLGQLFVHLLRLVTEQLLIA